MRTRSRGKWWTPLGLAALCAHCTLGAAMVAASATGLATLPTVGGLPLEWVAPPFLIFGGFGAWVWSGRAASRRQGACALPGHADAADAGEP